MIEELMRLVGFGLCHQLPERSFFGGGVQVPVCARDTGIYLGFMIAIFILWGLERGRRSSEVPPWPVSLTLGLFILAMVADGLTSYSSLRDSTNVLRLITGLMTGWALAAFTLALLNGQLWIRPGSGRVLPNSRAFIVYVAGLVVTFALAWWVAPLLGVAYPVIVTLSIFFTFSYVNAVVVALLPPFERKASRPADTWAVFAIAFGFTVVELTAAAALKGWMMALAGITS